MNAKHFFKGLSWLLVLNLLTKPVWIFLIDRQVQNIVGHEVYGIYFALYSLSYVLLFVADAGLSNMVAQRLASSEGLNLRQLLGLKIFLLLLYAVVCTMIALLAGISRWDVLIYLILIQSMQTLFIFLRGLLTARQYFKTDALFSVMDKTLLVLLCIGPVYGFFRPMTITLFLQAQTLSISVALCILLFFLAKRNFFTRGESVAVKTVLTWVTPFALILLLMSAHNRLDAFLLERLRPDGALQAGIYAAAYRLLDASNMMGYLTASFLVPFLSRHRQEKMLVQQVLLATRHGMLLCATGVAVLVAVFAPWLQQVLYHNSDAQGITVLRLCLAALPAYYLTHVYGSALTATAHFKVFIRILFYSVLANVLLNIWLIPAQGAVGCCIAALISQYGCGLLLWLAASRKLSISLSASSAGLYLLFAAILWASFYYGQKLSVSVWIILSSIAFFALVLAFTQRSAIKKIVLSFYQ